MFAAGKYSGPNNSNIFLEKRDTKMRMGINIVRIQRVTILYICCILEWSLLAKYFENIGVNIPPKASKIEF